MTGDGEEKEPERTYNVFIALEEDGGPTTWWSVDHFHDRAEAEAQVEEINEHIYNANGFRPERLED